MLNHQLVESYPCDYDQMESGREMLKEKGERFMDLWRGDDMVIFQNQYAI